MHASSLSRVAEFAAFLDKQPDLPERSRVLDVGSYDVNRQYGYDVQGSYRQFFAPDRWEYVGLDVEAGPGVDLVVDHPYRWSNVPSSSFDVVVSGQAFEHIEFPWVTIHEVRRVLKPGGWCCLVVPSAGHEHRFPVDCWRFYRDGLSALAAWGDLHVESSTTAFDAEGWDDDSDEWSDSVLVAQKPRLSGWRRVRAAGKHRVLRAAMGLQASRRTGLGD